MRKTVRVDIPISSPDDFNKLAEHILAKCKEMGADCPIKKAILEMLAKLLKIQDDNREESNRFHAQGEACTLKADTALGVAPGQNVNTKDTMYHAVTIIRDVLLIEYNGTEETLSEYGFNVVIGTSKSPSKKEEDN